MIQVREGDTGKLGLLFRRYHRPLFIFLFRMSSNKQESEDMLQTVFYRILKYRHTFSEHWDFRTWMYQLARNVLADTRQKATRFKFDDIERIVNTFEEQSASEEQSEIDQQLTMLHFALDRLKEEDKEVLILSRIQKMKYAQIATVLKISEGAVKVRVHRAMSELRSIYMKINLK